MSKSQKKELEDMKIIIADLWQYIEKVEKKVERIENGKNE